MIPACMDGFEEPGTEAKQTPRDHGSLSLGMMAAIFLAGPIFLLQITLFIIVLDLLTMSRPTSVAGYLGFALITAPWSIVVGAAIAFIPVLIGGIAMNALAEDIIWARRTTAWLAAGALLGGVIASLFNSGGLVLGVPLIITSIACAGICRRFIRWD